LPFREDLAPEEGGLAEIQMTLEALVSSYRADGDVVGLPSRHLGAGERGTASRS
jgi:hypothetical protein